MKTIIIANGTISNPERLLTMLQPGDRVIAADGGAEHCISLDILPEKVIGDFDSLDGKAIKTLEESGVQLERHPSRKDETDFELALMDALQTGSNEIVVFGALGARWDMSLANVLLLAHTAFKEARIVLIDGNQEVRLLQPGGELVIEGEIGDTVSLIPLAGDAQGIYTTGLEYPLENGTLRYGATRGVSNVLKENRASLSLDRGLLLCLVIRNKG